MRGTLQTGEEHTVRTGIIPAYAGNTGRKSPSSGRPRDHPRVCGEHLDLTPETPAEIESSPRMRGTHPCRAGLSAQGGIIPAYAGNTVGLKLSLQSEWDHPRVCGEHLPVRDNKPVLQGSSPRMRGTPVDAGTKDNPTRIIPAYAGNTSSGQVLDLTYRDHPRVCGEHYSSDGLCSAVAGSSPRMRGTP